MFEIVLIVIVLFDVFVTKIRKNEEARLQRSGESKTRKDVITDTNVNQFPS